MKRSSLLLVVFWAAVPLWAAPDNGDVKWQYGTGSSVTSSAAIGADGTIYVGSWDNHLYAINPDGTLGWRYETGNRVYSSPAVGSDGTIYVGSTDNYIYAINPDGTLLWDYETGGAVLSSPAVGSDGTIYVGSWDNYLYAINPDGTLLWSYQTGGAVLSSPAVGSDGTIYVGSQDSYVYAINPDSTLKWRYNTGKGLDASPALDSNGIIYIGARGTGMGSTDGYLYAINPDGTLLWRYQTDNLVYSSPAVGPDGTIYIGSTDHYLYAINPDNTLAWRYETGDRVKSSSPAVGSDGTVYVGSWDHYLYAINPDGTLGWRYETGGTVESSPAVGPDGTIYIGSNDGNLYALEGSSQGLASSAWPKFRHDRSNTGRFDYIDPPVADFSADPTSGEAPLTVTFTDQSAGLVTSWYWDFGDSFTSTEQNPIHTYEEWGLYTVSLAVQGPGGADTLIKEDYILVGELPVAEFGADPTEGCAPLTVGFKDASTGFPDSWFWEFGDDSTSQDQGPIHDYQGPGPYTVSLTVANPCGEDTETKEDYIKILAPDILVLPASIFAELEQGERETTSLYLVNIGICFLTFNIEGNEAPPVARLGSKKARRESKQRALPIGNRVLAGLDWLSFSPSEGEVDPRDYEAVEVTFEPGDRQQPGLYVGYLVITSNDPDPEDNPASIVCSLLVNQKSEAEEVATVPDHFFLAPKFANPLRGASQLEFSYGLPYRAAINISVYSVYGILVRTLKQGKMPAGYHKLTWDKRDEKGIQVAAGIYFARMSAKGYKNTCKIVILD